MLGWRRFSQLLTPQLYLNLANRAPRPPHESWLSNNLHSFTTPEFLSLLRSQAIRSLTPSLAPLLQSEAFYRVESTQFRNWAALFHLSKHNPNFEQLGMSLVPAFQMLSREKITKALLGKLSLTQVQLMLNAYVQLLYHSDKPKDLLFPTASGEDVFDLAAEVLSSALRVVEPADIPQWYSILRVYVLCDKGSEDFRRSLEQLVFSHLDQLPLHTIVDLPFIYRDRVTFDYHYIMTTVTGPYVQEVTRRLADFEARQIGLICYRLWWSLGKYGVYYSAEFVAQLADKIHDSVWISEFLPKDQVYLAHNFLVYLCNVGLPLSASLQDSLLGLILKHKAQLSSREVAQIAHVVARLHCDREDFWELVASHISAIVRDPGLNGYMYSTLLQLRFALPELHSTLQALPDVSAQFSSMQEHWKQQRTQDLTLSKESHQKTQVESFLKSRKITYELEYFDEFYIDVAVPALKLALEICGTMHYVMPMKVLNGKTLAKKYVLERLGWQVVIIPFFHQGVEGRFEQVLEDTLGPLLPPST